MDSLIWLNKLPDLNRLRTFHYVYAAGGITAAALELGLTRSALSQSVSLLEEELKTNLFKRVNRKLVPTQQGKALFNVTKELFSKLNNQIESISDRRQSLHGCLRIAAPVLFSQTTLLPLIRKFQKENPNATFQLQTTSEESLLSLNRDELDLCYIDSPELSAHHSTAFRRTLLQSEEEALVYASSYTNAKHLDTYEGLVAASFVSYYSNASDVKHWFKVYFGKHPAKLRIELQSTNVLNVVEGVKLGMGLGIVPIKFLEAEIRAGKIKVVRGKNKKAFLNKVFLLQQKGKLETKLERCFVDFCVES